MKLPLLPIPALVFLTTFATVANAQAFSDNFNRPNTADRTGGLGADWDVKGEMFLNSNVAKTQATKGGLALHPEFELFRNFVASVDMYAQSGGRYGGVVFNYKDDRNYYLLRASFAVSGSSAWQFIKYVKGEQTVVASGAIMDGDMPLTAWRKIKVSSTATPGQYFFVITDQSGGLTCASGILEDQSLPLSGASGFYFSGSNMWADNFSIQIAAANRLPAAGSAARREAGDSLVAA